VFVVSVAVLSIVKNFSPTPYHVTSPKDVKTSPYDAAAVDVYALGMSLDDIIFNCAITNDAKASDEEKDCREVLNNMTAKEAKNRWTLAYVKNSKFYKGSVYT
jgi:hypothetical protein